MVVSVVEVGDVRMAVRDPGVDVGVEMSGVRGVVVFMMAVVAGVLMFVFDGFVCVRVFVAAAKYEADAAAGDEQRSQLTAADGFVENGPGGDGTDEGCSGEDELSARGTEVSCPGDPEGD